MATMRQLIFLAALIASVWVSACGRQVTPNPPGLGAGGAPLGYIAIFFDVQQPFNFSQYQYMIVFNTTGSGVTPSTDTLQTNWNGYSFALIALGGAISTYAEPVQFLRNSNPHISPAWLPLHTTPQQFSYNLNNNGTDTESSLLVQKSVLRGIVSPSPSPSATPPDVSFNAFTTQASSQGTWQFFDSMGAGGPIDPQFVSPKLCMTEPFDNTYTAIYTSAPDAAAQIATIQTYTAIYTSAPDAAAQIATIQIANNPVNPTPCP